MNIVFDFGAVLFTWQPGQLLLQTFPERLHSAAEAAQLVHQIFGHADWHDFDRGVLDADTVVTRTSARLGLPLAELGQLVHGIGDRLTPIQDTVLLLETLRARHLKGEGVTGLHFLSNMPQPYARHLEDHHDFVHWFDGGIFSGDVKLIKPDLAIYQLLQNRYALEPAKTLFIDDLKTNVNAALSLGWQGIHFESAQQLEADLAKLGLL